MNKLSTLVFAVSASLVIASTTSPSWAAGSRLRPTALPDGSGRIALPPGWRIDGAARGSITAHGPSGEIAMLGVPVVIKTPAAGPAARGQLSAPYIADPVAAFTEVSQRMAALRGDPSSASRIVKSKRVASLSGTNAALILYENKMGGQPRRGYARVMTMQGSRGFWVLHTSTVSAPTAVFPRAIRPMLAMCQSLRRSPRSNVAFGGAPRPRGPARGAGNRYQGWGGGAPVATGSIGGMGYEPAQGGGDVDNSASEARESAADRFDRIAIRGTQMTTDPETGETMELQSANNQWTDGNGSYVGSDNPSFDPNLNSNVEWHEVQGE